MMDNNNLLIISPLEPIKIFFKDGAISSGASEVKKAAGR
jgi:hypothetical protein